MTNKKYFVRKFKPGEVVILTAGDFKGCTGKIRRHTYDWGESGYVVDIPLGSISIGRFVRTRYIKKLTIEND